MLRLRPSSPIQATEDRTPIVKAVPAERSDIEDGWLPETYEVDIVRALLQDPFRIFVYWHVRNESVEALTRYFSPEESAGFRTALRLVELTTPAEAFFDVDRTGRYWMTVYPEREYEFQIVLRSPVHGYIALVRSNRVRTPRGTVSTEPAQEEDYRLTPDEFLGILDLTGFSAEHSLSAAITGAPGLQPVDLLELLFARLPESIRRALAIVRAGGLLTEELIADLPEPLRSELLKLFRAGGGSLVSAALMHYLPEMLREVTESGREWIGDELHPLHIAPRFFLGGSERLPVPGGEMRWPRIPRLPLLPSSPGPVGARRL